MIGTGMEQKAVSDTLSEYFPPRRRVVVVGSGAAALTTAIAAADEGAEVIVIERTDRLGGSSAVSGGALWVPMNHVMLAAGHPDSRNDASAYCTALVAGRTPRELVDVFLDTAPDVVCYLEAKTPLRFGIRSLPDYRQEQPGAKPVGRMIEPEPVSVDIIGELAELLRRSAQLPIPLTLEEIGRSGTSIYPDRLPGELVAERNAAHMATMGRALVTGLLKGCLDLGVELRTGVRGRTLVRTDDRVSGIEVESGGRTEVLECDAVMLAAGGYEWNESIKRSFLTGTLQYPHTPPHNEGDCLMMAMDVGADLHNMGEVWWYPATAIEGETYDGRQLSRFVNVERCLPHSCMVNRYGDRFVNESANYNDLGKAFSVFDATQYGLRNQPAWLVVDAQFRERYRLVSVRPSDPDPDWLVVAPTLDALAERIDVDAARLAATIERFSAMARDGRDPDFGRGESLYDHSQGDPDRPDNPNLGTIVKAPFYAIPIYPGAVGTKGGPRTDGDARVLDVRGRPIEGLYAAGNAMGSIAGPAYFGGGTSIALAVVFGYLGGRHAARHDAARADAEI